MTEPPSTCAYCDRPAEYFCDYITDPRTDRTCDKPLCEEHRTRVGGGMICGRGKRGGCQPFTIDYCPGHAGMPDHPPFQPVGGGKAA